MIPKRRSHEYCARYITDPIAREKFTSLMTAADVLHTKATEMRLEAWRIYRERDDTKYA